MGRTHLTTLVINYDPAIDETTTLVPLFHSLRRGGDWHWCDAKSGGAGADELKSLWLRCGLCQFRLILLLPEGMIADLPQPLPEDRVERCHVVVIDPVARTGPQGNRAGTTSPPPIPQNPYTHGGVLRLPVAGRGESLAVELSLLLLFLATQEVPQESMPCARVAIEVDPQVLAQQLRRHVDRLQDAVTGLSIPDEKLSLELWDEAVSPCQTTMSPSIWKELHFGLLRRHDDLQHWILWLNEVKEIINRQEKAAQDALVECAKELRQNEAAVKREEYSFRALPRVITDQQHKLEKLQKQWRGETEKPDAPAELWADVAAAETRRFDHTARLRPNGREVGIAGAAGVILLTTAYFFGISPAPGGSWSALFTPGILLMLAMVILGVMLYRQNRPLCEMLATAKGKFQLKETAIMESFRNKKEQLERLDEIRRVQHNLDQLEAAEVKCSSATRLSTYHRQQIQRILGAIAPLAITADGEREIGELRMILNSSLPVETNPFYDLNTLAPTDMQISVPQQRYEKNVTSVILPGLQRITFHPRAADEFFGSGYEN